ncbi:hypothetical protein [Macrococcus animalis]|uniref:hypothetical protein n=1 Tax=Macrococcus animalis TaxID=3395467 RepID=UPI0039BDB44F
MKKYLSVFVALSVLLTGCGGQEEEKKAESPKKEVSETKKEEASKAEKAKEKIAKNKEKESDKKSTEPTSTEETAQQPATVEQQTTEQPVTQEPATQEAPTQQQPLTEEQANNNQPTEQQRIEFCKGIRGGIPEACRTPAILEAGNKKGAIERQASADLEAGLITQEQYDQKLREATEVMNQAWLQEYGVNPGQ